MSLRGGSHEECLYVVTDNFDLFYLLAGKPLQWVYHSNYDNVDVFLMDDTLTHGINENGRYFQITVKEVRNGQLLRTVMWEYEKLKYESDPWRYETSTMTHDHTCAVIAPDHLFEYCMNWLGWGYTIREHWYI